uniref:Uncharacterized protein n=1 Tax=Rhodnius prolixus TaxID=13249 RepID=T1IEA2_RHOPR
MIQSTFGKSNILTKLVNLQQRADSVRIRFRLASMGQ